MSNLTVRGNSLGTGTFIVESPNSNTSRTITLPDATGTLATTADSITQTQLATSLNATGTAPLFACRAWVNFNGAGTVSTNQTIKASGNIATVFKNAVGDYTITFTTAMPDANYVIFGTGVGSSLTNLTGGNSIVLQGSATAYVPNLKSASQFRIHIGNSTNGVLADVQDVSIAIFR